MNRLVLAPACSGCYVQRSFVLAVLGLMVGQAAYATNNDHLKIGAGAGYAPRYEGSDEHRAQPVPLLDYQYGHFFASTGAGVGFKLIQTPRFTAGAGLSWMSGYRSEDVPDGIGKLSGALGGRLFVSTDLAGAVLTLSATQAITKSERGLIANARLSYPYSVTGRLKIIPSVAVSWTNAKYMDSYFGVSARQSAASGLAEYRPSAGFKDVSMRLAANYDLTKSWSVTGAVGVSNLVGDAADSPLVKRKTQVRGMVGVSQACMS